MSNSNLTNGFKALGAACLLAVSSVSQAAITAFSDDFEGYGTAGVPSVPDFLSGSPGGWLGFSDNCGFPGGYGFIPSTTGPGISALGYNGTDNQYLNFFAQYENAACHTGAGPNSQEAISVYRDMPFDSTDTAGGDTWVFTFNFREADIPPAGSTEVGAYIRVFDPVRNLLHEVAIDTSGSSSWRQGILSIELDPQWTDGFFQVGFNNLVGNYEDSGMFYDDVSLTKALNPTIKIEGRGPQNRLHLHHDDSNVSPFLDDLIPVVVYGTNTLVGDPVDLDREDIRYLSVRFGPGSAERSGANQFLDADNDGQGDVRMKFLMSESGLGQPKGDCSDAESKANISFTKKPTAGDPQYVFAASDNFTPDCNAQCHAGP